MLDFKSTRRRQITLLVIVITLLLVAMIFGMWLTNPNKGQPSVLEQQQEQAQMDRLKLDYTAKPSNAMTTEEFWLSRSSQDLTAMQEDNAQLRDEIYALSQQINALQNSQQDLMTSTVPATSRLSPINLNQQPLPQPAVEPTVAARSTQIPIKTTELPVDLGIQVTIIGSAPTTGTANTQTSKKLGGTRLDGTPVPDHLEASQSVTDDQTVLTRHMHPNVAHYLPASSIITTTLLSGIDAPTGAQANTQPIPVLLRFMDDGRLPNFFNSGVNSCHALGASYGDLASERVYIRLESLTCIKKNGDVIESLLKGYVTGEDGKAGFRGKLVSKQGAILAKSLTAGLFGGLGNTLAQPAMVPSTTTTQNTTELFQSNMLSGAGQSLNSVAEFYLDRASETYPILEVDAGRIGEVILTTGTNFEQPLIGQTREKRP
jgi:conjugal transfer pilus assembly protein TraB